MNSTTKIIVDNGFMFGRMISWSKSGYMNKYPDRKPIFNANIFTLEEGKVWYGDVDLITDMDVLNNIAKASGRALYILREYDGRFENENIGPDKIKEKAVAIFEP